MVKVALGVLWPISRYNALRELLTTLCTFKLNSSIAPIRKCEKCCMACRVVVTCNLYLTHLSTARFERSVHPAYHFPFKLFLFNDFNLNNLLPLMG